MRLVKNTLPFIQEMPLWDLGKREWIKFILWKRQVEFLDLIHNNRLCILLKKRQVGGSQLTGADSLAQCMILDNFSVLILSKSGDDAVEFLRRIKIMYKMMPLDMRMASPLARDTESEMVFENGSRLISVSVNRGEGYTADRVIIDEAARITKRESHITLDAVLNNVEPVVRRAKGQLILVSKASGYNLFHNYYCKGKDNESSWKSFFFSCWDDPDFSKEDRKQIVIDQGEDIANENYPRNDMEAFLMSGRCCFNRSRLKLFMDRDLIKPPKKTFIEKIDERVFLKLDDDGWLDIYEDPIKDVAYVIGVDVAEGIEKEGIADSKQKTDFSALGVWKRVGDKYIQVARMKCRLNPNLWAEEVQRVALFYNYAYVAVERNKDGLGVLLRLKDTLKYTNLHYDETYDPDVEVRKRKLGWSTNKVSRPAMIRTADALIREDRVIFRSRETLSEFMTFVTDANGRSEAQEGCHDDECMAAMIAWEVFPKAPTKPRKNLRYSSYKSAKRIEDQYAKSTGY